MTAPTTSELIERLKRPVGLHVSELQKLSLLAASRLADLEREREEAEHRVCEGCGSSMSHAYLKAGGWRSCCPERKMLTANEWRDRAEAAERSLQEAKGVIERLASSEAFTVARMFLSESDAELLARIYYARAFLNRSAADGEGYGFPRPTLNADEGPGTNPQPDKSREGT